MKEENWYEHYKKRLGKLAMDGASYAKNLENDKPYLELIEKYVDGCDILETGCGLARTAINISNLDYGVTCIDTDERLLEIAMENAKKFGGKIKFLHLDLQDITEVFKENSFAAITHQGVLEHFSENKIKKILHKQLKIAPIIIFSVPVKTKRNEEYFKDGLVRHRNLWDGEKWSELLEGFRILEMEEAKQRTDNLIVVLGRKLLCL